MKTEIMRPEHIKGVVALENECFSEPWTEKGIAEELCNSNAIFFVTTDNENVIGYIGAHLISGECYITNIAVTEEYRRNGIGTLLLKTLCDKIQKSDADFITLEVRESNSTAIKLYKDNGFDTVGGRKKFYSNPEEDAYIMTKYFKGESK